MFGLENFDFKALWSPGTLLLLMLITAVYFIIIDYMHHKFKDATPVGFMQRASFLSGMLLLYIAHGSPLYLLGHLVFSAHMISMAIAYFAVPPLLILGTPKWLLRALLHNDKIKTIFLKITNPILTVILFNLLFSLYHYPMIFDFVMTHYTVHLIYFSILLFTAFLMWWSICCPLEEMKPLSELKKIGYIFASVVLLTPACVLIIFASNALFGTYTDPQVWAQALGYCVPGDTSVFIQTFSGPEFFAILPIQEDQQLGGTIMKPFQEFVFGIALAVIVYGWFRRERVKDEIDPLPSLN